MLKLLLNYFDVYTECIKEFRHLSAVLSRSTSITGPTFCCHGVYKFIGWIKTFREIKKIMLQTLMLLGPAAALTCSSKFFTLTNHLFHRAPLNITNISCNYKNCRKTINDQSNAIQSNQKYPADLVCSLKCT